MRASFTGSVFLGMSVDGFIARLDGDLTWLTGGREAGGAPEDGRGGDFGFSDFVSGVDALIMGRGTYEVIAPHEEWPYQGKPVHVLSSVLAAEADPRIAVHRSFEAVTPPSERCRPTSRWSTSGPRSTREAWCRRPTGWSRSRSAFAQDPPAGPTRGPALMSWRRITAARRTAALTRRRGRGMLREVDRRAVFAGLFTTRSGGWCHLMRDASVALPDGRSLAYTDVGPPGSPVVLYCHGAPSSRLDLAMFDEAVSALDVRLVAADRPGYGGSSPLPGRRREDWPVDVAVLADHLGIDSFAVLGLSSGGPYALTCAALLPDRVVAAATVGGETDFGWLPAWDDYPELEGELMRIGDEASGAAWCTARYGADGSRFLEGDWGQAPPADLAVFEDRAFATAFVATVREAFRQGVGGYAQDVVLQGIPWAFDPAAIAAPVWIHHGEADTLVPAAHARHTAEIVSGAQLVTWPDEGHVSLITKIPEIAAGLVAAR